MRWWMLVATLAAGCGHDSMTPTPSGPTNPTPSGQALNIALTDTVSGASIGSFTTTVPVLPARVTVTAPDHVPRSTVVAAAGQTVDLIPEAGFDLDFYRQFARGGIDGGPVQPLRTLDRDPSFYIQIEGAGFATQTAALLKTVAERIVPDLTGGRLHVAQWETGPETRPEQAGWVIVERVDEGTNLCGRAFTGTPAGHVWLDSNRACNVGATFAHELGHVVGFSHVSRPGSLMTPQQRGSTVNDAPTDIERLHGAIAYTRVRGNRDIDVDP